MEAPEFIFDQVETMIANAGFTIVGRDHDRPWGGFLVINEAEAAKFALHFFVGKEIAEIESGGKLSPKILIVAPGKRLSWQYHHRRAELWCCVQGPVSVATSETDLERDIQTLEPGNMINLARGERHRLIGMNVWGVVAEIWQHTDPENPSDESDIVRLQDDFGRSSGQ